MAAFQSQEDCPRTINIDTAFSAFLGEHGVEPLMAQDVAVEQRLLVKRKVSEQIGRWRGQGVQSPFDFIFESDEVVVTWRHPRFGELTGATAADENFVRVHEWIGQQGQRDFLLPCVAYLKLLGCDPIFVTDGARDEGIDCIGLVATGGFRSVAIFVQARSRTDLFAGDPLLQEYAKYAGLPRTAKYMQYLEALGLSRLNDGCAFVYAVLINSDFKYAAQQNAARLGVLLRSRRQMAQCLSSNASVIKLEQWKAQIAIPERGDLSTNISPLLR